MAAQVDYQLRYTKYNQNQKQKPQNHLNIMYFLVRNLLCAIVKAMSSKQLRTSMINLKILIVYFHLPLLQLITAIFLKSFTR